ncbi:MAG: UDP-3-O-(3-hydroxymyristoyl)glucosamine N-acyltransferase [Bacteroidales bacterium]
MEFKAINIAKLLGGTVVGDENISVHNVSKIEEGKPGTLAFLSNMKYEKYIYSTKASIVLVSADFTPAEKLNCTLIKVADPYQAVAQLLEMYEESKPRKFGIEEPSFISQSATVGDNSYIGAMSYIGENTTIGSACRILPQVHIGNNVKIGEGTLIYAGAKIYDNTIIGKNCIIHAGAVLGSDGFGFAPTAEGSFKKIAQIGHVIIEDEAEIGANTTIDCATMGATIIRKGVKLDNLIQIAHNCEIGEHTVIAALTAVAGSSKVGSRCVIGGGVMISGHITIGNEVKIAGASSVSNHVKDGQTIMGTPAIEHKKAARGYVVQRRLPELKATVDQLEKELNILKEKLG